MELFRRNISAMSPYTPGEQPGVGQKVIKLNTNENPYPPSPAAMKVLRELDGERLRRYPQPTARDFQIAAGAALGYEPDWILPGNGSDDLLTMIFRGCTEPGRAVAYPMPTYTLYRTLAQIQNAETIEVPFDDDFRLPVDALAAAGAAVTIVANPNAPSGTPFTLAELESLARRVKGLMVIDEAYADFADSTAVDLPRRRENVIVLRTLSKGYSLAGLRLGFGIARPDIHIELMKVKDSYNVDAVACAAGAAAIADQAYKNDCAAKVKASRTALAGRLAGLGFKVWPSQTNFLLVRPPVVSARQMYEGLKERGILIRYFNQPRLDDKLRISIGTEDENAQLVRAIEAILSLPGSKA
jgi:histidinol-phosphate aminotransferase